MAGRPRTRARALANKQSTGDPALRKALIEETANLIPTPAELDEMDKEIFKGCGVAKHHAGQMLKDRIFGLMHRETTHSKMKIALDWISTAFLHPVFRKRLLMAALEDPLAFARIMAALMPKDINVQVTKQQGVILVPMRMENVEDWEAKAIAEMSGGETIEMEAQEPRVGSWEEIVAGGGQG